MKRSITPANRNRSSSSSNRTGIRRMLAFLSAVNRILRSRAFRQFVTAVAPFVAMLMHSVVKHYGLL